MRNLIRWSRLWLMLPAVFLPLTSLAFGDQRLAVERQNATAARIANLTAERILFAADQALDAASIIASSIDNRRLVHEEFRRLAENLPGVRAIISIDKNGVLEHDSYTYPPRPIKLNDRTYYQKAALSDQLIIGTTVTGRSSGAGFVPLAKKIGTSTYVAIATPFALVSTETECADCWSAATTRDGKPIALFPPEQVPEGFLRFPSTTGQEIGSRVVRFANSVVVVSWRKSEVFGLISVAIRGLPDSTSPDIDIN